MKLSNNRSRHCHTATVQLQSVGHSFKLMPIHYKQVTFNFKWWQRDFITMMGSLQFGFQSLNNYGISIDAKETLRILCKHNSVFLHISKGSLHFILIMMEYLQRGTQSYNTSNSIDRLKGYFYEPLMLFSCIFPKDNFVSI